MRVPDMAVTRVFAAAAVMPFDGHAVVFVRSLPTFPLDTLVRVSQMRRKWSVLKCLGLFGLTGEWRAECDVTGDEKRRCILLIQQIMGREGTHGRRTHPILLPLDV